MTPDQHYGLLAKHGVGLMEAEQSGGGFQSSFRLIVLATLSLNACTGCTEPITQLKIESFRESGGRVLHEKFENGIFARDAHQNYDLVFEVPAGWAPATQPAGEQSEGELPNPQGSWVSQILHIRVFWTPRPGRTFAESSQTNAAIRYFLLLDNEVMSYEGAGFVYFEPPEADEPFIGRLESASLKPAQRTANARDIFGPCRLTGSFVAAQNLPAVLSSLQGIRRRMPIRATAGG